MQEAVRGLKKKTLFGPVQGWSLEPVALWLLSEARHLTDARELVDALMERLDSAGASIDRFRLTCATLHPQLIAWGVAWDRGGDSKMWNGQHGVELGDAYIGSPIQFVRERNLTYRIRLDARIEEGEHATLADLRAMGISEYVALPLVFGTGSVNVLTLSTMAPAGFNDADVERFEALVELLAPLVEIIAERRTTLGLLDTFVGPRISRRILDGQVRRGDGDQINAAFWYSDLRGFTGLSERLPTAELLHLLNDYFENCAAAAAARGGEILQFIGDAILIVFEIDEPGKEAEVCESALDAAIDAFDSLAVVNHRRRHAKQPVIEFGLGLHLGVVTHANVGSPGRLAFNVVGPAVNTTARIQSLTKQTGVPLLLSSDFARLVKRPLRHVGRFELRGVAETEELFTPADR